MELIIDIPEEKYKTIQEGMYCGMLDADLYRDIKNGIPLDALKAEIEQRKKNSGGEPNRELAFNVCLQIIDKYRNGVSE